MKKKTVLILLSDKRSGSTMLQKACVNMLKFKLLLTPTHIFRDTPLAKRSCNIKI